MDFLEDNLKKQNLFHIPITFRSINKILNSDWLNLNKLEMQLIGLQSSSVWTQKFNDLRQEVIENDRYLGIINQSAEDEILTIWNEIRLSIACNH